MDELKNLLDQAFGLIEKAEAVIDQAMYTAPNGVVYIDTPEAIREIQETQSWR